jgi:hypothetical protein
MNVYCSSKKIYYHGYTIYSSIPIELNNISQSILLTYIQDKYPCLIIGNDIFILHEEIHECLNSLIFIETRENSMSEALRYINVPNITFSTNIPNKFDISYSGTLRDFLIFLHKNSDIHCHIDNRHISLFKCNEVHSYDLSFSSNHSDLARQIETISRNIDVTCTTIHANHGFTITGSCRLHDNIKECINIFHKRNTEEIKLDVGIFELRTSKALNLQNLNIIDSAIGVCYGQIDILINSISQFFERSYSTKCVTRNLTSCTLLNGQSTEIRTGVTGKHDLVYEKINIQENNTSMLKVTGHRLNDGNVLLNIDCFNKDLAGSNGISYCSCVTKVMVKPGESRVISCRTEKRELSNSGIFKLFHKSKKEYVVTIIVVHVRGENEEI